MVSALPRIPQENKMESENTARREETATEAQLGPFKARGAAGQGSPRTPGSALDPRPVRRPPSGSPPEMACLKGRVGDGAMCFMKKKNMIYMQMLGWHLE